MFEFALMGFGKIQDTVTSNHIAQALQEFETRRGGSIPRGWFVQFQHNSIDPIPACPTCGCKRCPHATDHNLACTDSNDPGQPGSAYE